MRKFAISLLCLFMMLSLCLPACASMQHNSGDELKEEVYLSQEEMQSIIEAFPNEVEYFLSKHDVDLTAMTASEFDIVKRSAAIEICNPEYRFSEFVTEISNVRAQKRIERVSNQRGHTIENNFNLLNQTVINPSDLMFEQMTTDEVFELLGASKREIDGLSLQTKQDLLDSKSLSRTAAYYGVAENGETYLVSARDLKSGAERINAGERSVSVVDSRETQRIVSGFFTIVTYTANPHDSSEIYYPGRETLTTVSVTWDTTPSDRKVDVVGITLTNNYIIPNSPTAIMTYTKTRYAAYLDPIVENLQVNYSSVNAVSVAGSEGSTVCFEFDLPENETLVNGWWYECSNFMIVMTCRGFFPLGTTGEAGHWAVGYYSHAMDDLSVDTHYTVGVEYNQSAGVTYVASMTVIPEKKEVVKEGRAPVYLESTYG